MDIFLIQYLAVYNNDNLPNSIIIGPGRFKILPSTKATLQKLPKRRNFTKSGHTDWLGSSVSVSYLLWRPDFSSLFQILPPKFLIWAGRDRTGAILTTRQPLFVNLGPILRNIFFSKNLSHLTLCSHRNISRIVNVQMCSIRGSTTVQLTSCLFSLDSAALLVLIYDLASALLIWSNPNKSGWSTAAQKYFPLRWVFSGWIMQWTLAYYFVRGNITVHLPRLWLPGK